MTPKHLCFMATVLVLSTTIVQSAYAGDGIGFAEESGPAGLTHTYGGGADFVVGGGVAAFDCNNDGLPELFLAGGGHGSAFFLNQSQPSGRLKFVRATERLGVPSADLERVTGAYPLDFDSDGRLDLMVLRFGRNLLLRGTGDCRFEPAGSTFGLPETSDYTTAFAAIWEAGYSLPTLAVGNYVNRARPLEKTGNCDNSYLLRGQSPKSLTYGRPTTLGTSSCTMSMLFVDWSGTGVFDLRVANDRQYFDPGTTEQLWRLTPRGARLVTKAEGWDGPVIWGMGLAARDLDGDGRPEIAVTNMADNRLEKLAAPASGTARFENVALSYNTMSQRPYVGDDKRPSTSWNVQFADFNNDAMADLWIVKGNVDAMPQFAAIDPDSLLIGGPNAKFTEQGEVSGIARNNHGRGGLAIDLNGDGRTDLVTINRDQPVTLFRNVSTGSGGWLDIALRQPGGNPFAVGATVFVKTRNRTQSQQTTVGGGHASGAAVPLHFGLGAAKAAQVRVRWPDGSMSDWRDYRGGRSVVVEKG